MSCLIEFLVTGNFIEEEFHMHIVYPNNLDKQFLTTLHFMFKPYKNDEFGHCFYDFQLTDEFGKLLYASCYINKGESSHFIVCFLSSHPKIYTFRKLLGHVHKIYPNDIYPFIAYLCKLVVPLDFKLELLLNPSLSIELDYFNDCPSHLLLNYLNPNLVSIILHDFLLEKSILFVSTSMTKLTHCSLSFQMIIEPLVYPGIIVPLVPQYLIHTIEAPTFYLMGCHPSALIGSINFKQCDLVIDLDNLQIINEISQTRHLADIESYTRKVFKVIGGLTCQNDSITELFKPKQQEEEFRVLWHSWIINLCSEKENKAFYTLFSKTSMFSDTQLDTVDSKSIANPLYSVEIDDPIPIQGSTIETQEQFINLVSQLPMDIQLPKTPSTQCYYLLLKHIHTHLIEYNPLLEFDDCKETIKSLLETKNDPLMVTTIIKSILKHCSDPDKLKCKELPLNAPLLTYLDSIVKKRSTQLLRKSMYMQPSQKSIDTRVDILGPMHEAFSTSNSNLAQMTILNSDLPLNTSQLDGVEATITALSTIIQLYNEITSLMYRSDIKDPIAKSIADRKKIQSLAKSNLYTVFLNQLASISLRGNTKPDCDKLCFWLNMRQILYLHALIVTDINEVELKATTLVGYKFGQFQFSLMDMTEGCCRPNSNVRFYTKSHHLWRGLSIDNKQWSPVSVAESIHFIISDYTNTSCRIQCYSPFTLQEVLLKEVDLLLNTEFKIDIKKKRILMPLPFSWLYKEFGDHPNEMVVYLCELLPQHAFTLLLKTNDALRYENNAVVRISRKWTIKFNKEGLFCIKFIK